jgi:hypothetical protein
MVSGEPSKATKQTNQGKRHNNTQSHHMGNNPKNKGGSNIQNPPSYETLVYHR